MNIAPSGIQAIMFSKIFSYVRNIDNAEGYKVIIVYDNNSGYPKDINDAFTSEGIKTYVVNVTELRSVVDVTKIIYLPESLSRESLERVTALRNKLFISGQPEYTSSGYAALSVGIENERIKILINLKALANKNQEVSAELLNLAKVVE